jgi:hypothetical protein
MRINFDKTKEERIEAQIEHNGIKLFWNISSFIKGNFTPTYDPCDHINKFWEKLEPFKQQKIFDIFAKIRDVFEDNHETVPLIQILQPLMKGLYEEHTLDNISRWLAFYVTDVLIPDNIKVDYIQDDEKPGSREKTYTRSDYESLVTMTVAMRLMIPIWGEFIYRTKNETGTEFKEYYAFQLLAQTPLMHCAAMEKMKIYVDSNIQLDKSMATAIYRGIGTEDYPNWLLSAVLVNRICMGDITGVNPMKHLITVVWNFLNNKINGTGTFGEMIRNKEFKSGDSSSSDDNASRLESYKLKQDVAIGEIEILNTFMDDPINVATLLKPNINLQLLEKFLTAAEQLQNEQLWEPQVILAQWVMKPVLSPRGMVHLSKKKVINALAITQTVLWENGHRELACLITAIASDNSKELQMSSIGTGAKIPDAIKEEINFYYPFNKIMPTKLKTKPNNVALVAIDSVANKFTQRDWIITAPNEFASIITGSKSHRRYGVPHDIKILLARLVVEIAKRN